MRTLKTAVGEITYRSSDWRMVPRANDQLSSLNPGCLACWTSGPKMAESADLLFGNKLDHSLSSLFLKYHGEKGNYFHLFWQCKYTVYHVFGTA